ncbi:glycoside hydrolase family 13 protein [Anaerocolumna xylanovorans]|uniref:Glycosidase n=1 Tax=Anaerocolumna xylanovorans DSM 12503 TaxID=1121345 RepID=A0A1M7XXB4_9FIRM|nr:glycoside hydrolase family 13 protein [Anaerocolumna xylanovorans]SHO43372.1 Glycosidase [Anaerocolumna xylanovorans DSM 12503]
MNLEAINHTPKSSDAHAYGENTMHIRLRTAKDDALRIELVYGIKYDWMNYKTVPMKKILTDNLYDYYQANLELTDTRIGYYFKIEGKEESFCYTEGGFLEKFPDDMSYCYFFQYPYINKADVHREPVWVKDAVFYQIFVERFFNGDEQNSPKDLVPWDSEPKPKSFFGGDLKGILMKLDYLAELGINGLYLTPIFESPSNHKYDTVDYREIDKYFGDKEVFGELVRKSHEKGIKIILDAVFNHCSDSFAPFKDVKEKGKASPYHDWFFIEDYPLSKNPLNYQAFGYISYMPKLNTSNKEVKKYLFDTVRYWMEEFDIDGWRLDVSDEIDHCFWREFRNTVKGIKEDAIIIGENWHNAYPWLMGDQFDSVMNYPVTKLCMDYFARNIIGAKEFEKGLATLLMRYADQVNEAMLNFLDSHDTERFLYTCKENKGYLMNAAAFLFSYIGIPCTYYGTEIGMTGAYDPGCRRGFDWEREHWDKVLYDFYKKLIQIRKEEKALKHGTISFHSENNLFIMKRSFEKETIYVVINNTEEDKLFELPEKENAIVKELLSGAETRVEKVAGRFLIPAVSSLYLKTV